MFDEDDGFIMIDKTVLRYRFILENTGRRPMGSPEKPIWAAMEHDSDLINEIALTRGHGYIGAGVIPAGEAGEIEIYYELGVNDTKGVTDSLPVPDPEILDEIESTAWDAVLVIIEGPMFGFGGLEAYVHDGSLPEGARELKRIDLREYK